MEKSIRHHPIALLVVDVNGLKLVNDAFGHEAGDLLLKTVATILQKNCREDDRIGRVGGDEFFVLLSRTGIEEAKKVKRRILELAEEEKFRQIPVSLAIGIGIKETPGDSMDGVRRIADNNMYKNKLKYGRAMRMEVVDTVLQDLYETYPGERLHGEQVALYAGEIAEAMGLGEEDEDEMRMAGHLHDIGKIMVPPEILGKPDTLTMDEMRIVRRHPEIGYQILKSVDVYAPLTVAALSHHEWWDGSGYPEGLKGEEIPLMARIIAVADAYDAMTNRRSGRRSYTEDEAKAELLRRRGSQFDPEVVAAFLSQNPPDKQETKDY